MKLLNCTAIQCMVSTLPVVSAVNTYYYWGQNSLYHVYPSDSSAWEKPLAHYCSQSWVDNVILSFMNVFPSNVQLNHANHCWNTFPGTQLLNCPNIATDIAVCKSQGKRVGLALGGAIGTYGFTSDLQAQQFARTFYCMFLEGRDCAATNRPYGSTVLDFVDLNIESGSWAGYAAFARELKALTGNRIKVVATGQCPYPDAYIGPGAGRILDAATPADAVNVQFYNNYCGLASGSSFNMGTWAQWSASNGNVPVYIGFPSHPKGAGSGFVDITTLSNVINNVYSQYRSSFGGVMGWDVGLASVNNYGAQVKAILNNLNTSTTRTSTTTTTSAVSTTTSATRTSTTTSTTSTVSYPKKNPPRKKQKI